jgi:translation elongation factor EF-G
MSYESIPTDFAARFDKARKRLSSSLKNLEEAIKEKIHEAANQQIKIVGDKYESQLEGRYSLPAFNVSQQVNQLQKELFEVGNEVEFEREKSRALLEKIENFQQEKTKIVAAIEENIDEIEKLINLENEESEAHGS